MKVYLMESRLVVGSLTEVSNDDSKEYISVFKDGPPVNHRRLPLPYQKHILSKSRPDYNIKMGWLGLWPPDDKPMGILSRIGKGTQTDNYYIAPDPTKDYYFFIQQATEHAKNLEVGQTLLRVSQFIATDKCYFESSDGGKIIGRFPPLVDYPKTMVVHQINPDAPLESRILLKVTVN